MVSSRTASAPPQKKCKKKGLPHYFNATAPFCLPIDGHKHVGAILTAKPLSSAWSRQHAPDFPGRPTSMLASTSPQSLCPSSSHANTPRLFPVRRHHCWRRPSRKAFVLRRATPTRPGFSRPAGAHVGVALIAKPLSFVELRQHPKA